MFKFQDTIYLEYKKHWFLWEPAWERFRPILGMEWNGSGFVVNDKDFCFDPMDILYGYGSPTMKQVCDALTETFASQISTATPLDTPEIGKLEWFYDRRIALAGCCPRDKASWKRMVRGKYRTLRKGSADKFTRRNRSSR